MKGLGTLYYFGNNGERLGQKGLRTSVDIIYKVFGHGFPMQETTNAGVAKAQVDGKCFSIFVPDEMNPALLHGGQRYFVKR